MNASPEDDSRLAKRRVMSREDWLRHHVARAPKITPEQWRKTRAILRNADGSLDQ